LKHQMRREADAALRTTAAATRIICNHATAARCAMMTVRLASLAVRETQGSPAIEANACPDATPSYARYGIVPALAAVLCATTAQADPIEDFYKGRTVTIVTSTGVGGPFDLTGAWLAKHHAQISARPADHDRAQHAGGGNVLATNYMYTQARRTAPRSASSTTSSRCIRCSTAGGVRFDARRFNWAGLDRRQQSVHLGLAHRRLQEHGRRQAAASLITGSTGVGSGTFIYPNAMNMILGTRIGSSWAMPARRRSISPWSAARCRHAPARASPACCRNIPTGSATTRSFRWSRSAAKRDKDYPDVPLMHELGKNDEQRQVLALVSSPPSLGRPFFTHAGCAARACRRAARGLRRQHEGRGLPHARARQLGLDMHPMQADVVTQIVFATINAPRGGGQGQGRDRPQQAPPAR